MIYLKASVKTAQNIVNTLGENAINDILTRPEILESVPSLQKKKQKQIADQINANQESEKIMIRLRPRVWSEIINGYISVLYG